MKKTAPTPFSSTQQQQKGTQVLRLLQTMAESFSRRGATGGLGKQFGTKRDLYDVLGYRKVPSLDDYWNLFLRQDLARRVITAPVKATWRKPPLVVETKSPNVTTKFEAEWEALTERLPVWRYFARADRLAGIGYYGVLLIGAKGNLDTPLSAKTFKGQKDVLYLAAYAQRHASVSEFDGDPRSPRFGKPLYYDIDLSGDLAGETARAKKTPGRSVSKTAKLQKVHHTRVLHFAEDLTEDEVHGTPRLESILNRLDDVEKVAGSSAEGYWRGAYGGISLETADDAVSAFADAGAIDTDVMDEFAHGMRRWIDLQGYKLKQIQGQDFRPEETFSMLIALISAATNIPQRLLLGSERGQLASSQDESNWDDHIQSRREEYAEPLVKEFINTMQLYGALPDTKYEVEWPELHEPTEKERAEIASIVATAIKNVAPVGSPELVVTPEEFRTRWLDLPATPVGTTEFEAEEDDEELHTEDDE